MGTFDRRQKIPLTSFKASWLVGQYFYNSQATFINHLGDAGSPHPEVKRQAVGPVFPVSRNLCASVTISAISKEPVYHFHLQLIYSLENFWPSHLPQIRAFRPILLPVYHCQTSVAVKLCTGCVFLLNPVPLTHFWNPASLDDCTCPCTWLSPNHDL